ncbi:MAG TPA: hypothetical protein VG900_10740 [Hyphomicrobiaceae bacterium]|jgi:hypothetical protein|nr:hypothetical protein [Hyphomicrobiaceae bacterium]
MKAFIVAVVVLVVVAVGAGVFFGEYLQESSTMAYATPSVRI